MADKLKAAYRRLINYKLGKLKTGGFDERLVDLVFVADGDNRVMLAARFPDEVAAHDAWRTSPEKFLAECGDPDDPDVTQALENLTEYLDG